MTPLTRPLGPDTTLRWLDVVRLLRAARDVPPPSALAGMTLAALRGWPGCEAPDVPQLVVPTSREPVHLRPGVARLRRVEHWDGLRVETGPLGLRCLGALDGFLTLAPEVEDAHLHLLLQELAFRGELDLTEVLARRRTGLPGSARVSRVTARYRLGFDSPSEVSVYELLRRCGRAPDHLNAYAVSGSGVVAGPFDALDDCGAAYEVDGVTGHDSEVGQARDRRKDARAARVGVVLVRFAAPDIRAKEPVVLGWDAARAAARGRLGPPIAVLHQASRDCPCGHRAGGLATLWTDRKITA